MEEITFGSTLEYIRRLRKEKKSKEGRPTNEIKHKEYHLWRWKIKRILIEEKIIDVAFDWETVLDTFDDIIIETIKDASLINKPEFKGRLIEIRTLLIEHHTKYKEIHGYDETIWMTPSEHRYLHNRLRRDGKCNVDPKELEKISNTATGRTDKRKKYQKEYHKTEKFKDHKSEYCKTCIMRIMFTETLAPNIRFYEEIAYNLMTNTITVSSGFNGYHGTKLPIIQIHEISETKEYEFTFIYGSHKEEDDDILQVPHTEKTN